MDTDPRFLTALAEAGKGAAESSQLVPGSGGQRWYNTWTRAQHACPKGQRNITCQFLVLPFLISSSVCWSWLSALVDSGPPFTCIWIHNYLSTLVTSPPRRASRLISERDPCTREFEQTSCFYLRRCHNVHYLVTPRLVHGSMCTLESEICRGGREYDVPRSRRILEGWGAWGCYLGQRRMRADDEEVHWESTGAVVIDFLAFLWMGQLHLSLCPCLGYFVFCLPLIFDMGMKIPAYKNAIPRNTVRPG